MKKNIKILPKDAFEQNVIQIENEEMILEVHLINREEWMKIESPVSVSCEYIIYKDNNNPKKSKCPNLATWKYIGKFKNRNEKNICENHHDRLLLEYYFKGIDSKE